VTRPDEESEKERVWRVLSEAGLIDIPPDEFAERIKEAKHVVMGRLSELLEQTTDIQEREAAAYSLATLKELERTVSRSGRRISD
jgi:DNA-binding ferritin-like protein